MLRIFINYLVKWVVYSFELIDPCSNKIIIFEHQIFPHKMAWFTQETSVISIEICPRNGIHYKNYCFERPISLSFSLSFIGRIDIQTSHRHLNKDVRLFWFFILIIASYTHSDDSVLQLIYVNGCWLPKFSFVKCMICNQSHDHQTCVCLYGLASQIPTTFTLSQIYLNFQLSHFKIELSLFAGGWILYYTLSIFIRTSANDLYVFCTLYTVYLYSIM